MKKWILLIVLAGSFSAHAQQVKAKTNTTTTHSKTAVNVSDSDEIYSYSAIFDLDKSKKAINEIEKVFGQGKKEGNYTTWRDGEKLEIKVREGKITIEFEKGSTALYEKVKHLGESISETVGSKK